MRAAFLVVLASLVACQPEPPPAPIPGALPEGGTQIGKAGESVITQEMIDAVEVRIPADQVARIKATGRYTEFLDRIALGQVLYERAVAAGMHEQPDIQVALAMSARDVLAAELLDKVGAEAVTEEKVAEAYEARKVQFARPTVHARQIVVTDLTVAEDLKKKLEAGADFATLAAENSIDPGTREQGGDLGWFEKERYFAEVTEPAFTAAPGTLLGPIETRLGYHLVLVEDRREVTPLDEVRPALEQAIRDEAIEAYVAEVEKSTVITWAPAGEAPAGEAPSTAGGEGTAAGQ